MLRQGTNQRELQNYQYDFNIGSTDDIIDLDYDMFDITKVKLTNLEEPKLYLNNMISRNRCPSDQFNQMLKIKD